jgi:hypothetical protein
MTAGAQFVRNCRLSSTESGRALSRQSGKSRLIEEISWSLINRTSALFLGNLWVTIR